MLNITRRIFQRKRRGEPQGNNNRQWKVRLLRSSFCNGSVAAAAFCMQLNCGSQFLYAPAGLRENSSEAVNVEITRESELCYGENKAHE